MSVVRYRQWPASAVLHRDPAGVVAPLLRAVNAMNAANVAAWQPAVDIRHEADQFVLQADLPGVDPEQITLEMDKNVLVIKGQRTAPSAEGQASGRRERVFGSFERRFSLPDTADTEQITASSQHGVLEVRIAKRAELAPRRIAVSVAGA